MEKRTDSTLALIAFGCDEQVRRELAGMTGVKIVRRVAMEMDVRPGRDYILTRDGWSGIGITFSNTKRQEAKERCVVGDSRNRTKHPLEN